MNERDLERETRRALDEDLDSDWLLCSRCGTYGIHYPGGNIEACAGCDGRRMKVGEARRVVRLAGGLPNKKASQ